MTAAGLAQSLERLTAERVVVGSIPRVRPILRVLGCVRGGNTDLDFQNLNPDFPIERTLEITKILRLYCKWLDPRVARMTT